MCWSAVRTLVDPDDPADVKKAHALQDAIKVEQPGGPGKFEVPKWDPVSQKKVRDALLVLATTVTDTSQAFGTKDQVDPVQRLIGAASAWGGNPPKDAMYLNFTPAKNDGKTVYKLTVKDVPVDGFWSISLYNAEGYFEKNELRRLFAQQHHGEEERRRLGRHPVRRLRRQDPQLPADHAGLELHGAALSPARRNPERQVEIPGGATGQLREQAMSGFDIFAWIVLIILVASAGRRVLHRRLAAGAYREDAAAIRRRRPSRSPAGSR